MIEEFGKRFFGALQAHATVQLGPDHPCVVAISRAIETGEPADVQDAQCQLSGLPASIVEPMMRAAHKSMREDPAALLNLWNGGPPGRSN